MDELAELRQEVKVLRKETEDLRKAFGQLATMVKSVRIVFGGATDAATSSATSSSLPPDNAAWGMWKSRLPGACPKVIDALLIQPLTATQLISATGTSYSTVQRALNVLENNSLIERDGTRIRLKRL